MTWLIAQSHQILICWHEWMGVYFYIIIFRCTPTLVSFSSSFLQSLELALQLWYVPSFVFYIFPLQKTMILNKPIQYDKTSSWQLVMIVNHDLGLTLLLYKVLRADLGTSLDESMKGAMAKWDIWNKMWQKNHGKKHQKGKMGFDGRSRQMHAEN